MLNRRNLLGVAAALGVRRRPALSARGLEERNIPNSPSPWFRPRTPPASATAITPFVEYLSKELGVPVKLRVANDYAAVIEGQRAGNIQIAYYGPASYRTRL